MSSSNPQRGFIPAQNDQERLVMRRAEDLCRVAGSRGIARYTGFLSDREQALCQAALNRLGWQDHSFQGGYPQAERRILCIEPADAYQTGEPPICCIRIECTGGASGASVSHKDYLGSILGLGLERSCLGDILPFEGGAYAVVLENAAEVICSQLCSVGRLNARAERFYEELPTENAERDIQSATVSSLRADAVIAAMCRIGRGRAAQLLSGGGVEINHIAVTSPHTPVYKGDIFTIRGVGRYKLTTLGGKSRKDRVFIEYFKY